VRPILEDARFTLHHVRRRLPAEVRVVTPGHALTGQALRARHVYRRYGQRWLVLELPRGGVVSVEVEDTDLLDTEPGVTAHSGVCVKPTISCGRGCIPTRSAGCMTTRAGSSTLKRARSPRG